MKKAIELATAIAAILFTFNVKITALLKNGNQKNCNKILLLLQHQ
jgi:hypothetical protein